jgi:Mg2+/Co2+ transporter CorB
MLLAMLVLSAFFSSSETAMTSLNHYKLKHLVAKKIRGAYLAEKLLKHPAKLISMILIGNNLVNISASVLATTLAINIWGESSIVWVTLALTICILLFAEIIPKSVAVTYPEKIAFPASYILYFLMKILSPVVWIINYISQALLSIFKITIDTKNSTLLNRDQLRTVVLEAGAGIPREHRKMLLSMLDLSSITVEDIMVLRDELVGINISDDIDDIKKSILNSKYNLLIVYQDNIDNCLGFIAANKCNKFLMHNNPNKKMLLSLVNKIYFIPMHVDLYTQLVSFRIENQTCALVVDEYGVIQGMLTVTDIIKEIMGEFNDGHKLLDHFKQQDDGSYIFNAVANIREINAKLGWNLPQEDTKTINGLILSHLGYMPSSALCFVIDDYCVEILDMGSGTPERVKISPTY